MKSLLLSCLVLAATLAAVQHNVACQEEAAPTTTLAPSAEETKQQEPTTTQVPTAVETTPESSSPANATEEAKPEESKTEEIPKEADKKGDDDDDVDKPADGKEEEEKPKEDGEMEQPASGPQQPKIIFVQQHIRDPNTGVIYTRQVPLIPSNFLRPMPYEPRGQQPPQPPVPEARPQESAGPYDPLGQFSAAQKKRQFFQDMLMSQLVKFEREIEPMLEREDNVTEKNDIEEMLGGVTELKRTLEGHQIFNISDIMNNWKQGRLGQEDQQPGESSAQPQGLPQPNYKPRNPQQQPQLTLRTLILVPQRSGPMGPQQPQQPPHYPYQMNRQIPLIHLHQRRGSPAGFQPDAANLQAGSEQLEPQAAPSEEYSNTNDIFGY